MPRRKGLLLALVVLLGSESYVSGEDKTVRVELRRTKDLLAGPARKLSPSLLATKHAEGVLKGADAAGRPVINLKPGNIARLTASTAVSKMYEETPRNWNPVKKIKLSYKAGDKPTDADLSAMGLQLIEDYQKGSFMIAEPISKVIDAELVNKLEASSKVKYATAALRVQAIPPSNTLTGSPSTSEGAPPTNDPRWSDLWGMRNINAPKAWQAVHDSDIVVAVIDTGVDYNHPDLAANMWANDAGKHGRDFVDDDADPMDLNSHGTHCAGTIGAIGNNTTGVVGVCWKVRIMALRWLDAEGSGELSDAIKCIDYAAFNGAKVLSNSWFWPEDDPSLEEAIGRAKEKGVLFVAAAANFAEEAGNNSGDNDKLDTLGRFPGAYTFDNIISVAAIDSADNLAGFSNWGKNTVDIGAPGVLITSTVPNNGYDGTFSGTSMATPHVAGAAALIWARDPGADFALVKAGILDNARKINSLKDRCVTGGTLDISFLNTTTGSGANGDQKPGKR